VLFGISVLDVRWPKWCCKGFRLQR